MNPDPGHAGGFPLRERSSSSCRSISSCISAERRRRARTIPQSSAACGPVIEQSAVGLWVMGSGIGGQYRHPGPASESARHSGVFVPV
jgi:hypothetical protein